MKKQNSNTQQLSIKDFISENTLNTEILNELKRVE